jgi:Integral membrane protein TerC family
LSGELLFAFAAGAAVLAGLALELHLFAPSRPPRRGEAIIWSTGWLLIAMAVGRERACKPARRLVDDRLPHRSPAHLCRLSRVPWRHQGDRTIRQPHPPPRGSTIPITTEFRGRRLFVRKGHRLYGTPLLVVLAIILADIAFAVDSIPTAFAVTHGAVVLWTANAFALLGLGSLLALADILVRRFRYLGKTIALILAFVGIKILAADVVHISDLGSLAVIAALLAGGVAASLTADRLDPLTRPNRPGDARPAVPHNSHPGVRADDNALGVRIRSVSGLAASRARRSRCPQKTCPREKSVSDDLVAVV